MIRRLIILLLIVIGSGQDCPENMFWDDCGSACVPTCLNPEVDPDDACTMDCVVGCFCNFGLFLLSPNLYICVPLEDCYDCPDYNSNGLCDNFDLLLLQGDVSLDGVVNIIDLLDIIWHIIDPENFPFSYIQLLNADLNIDGVIDILDLVDVVYDILEM
tara:strand:- start:6806 stop:7282 length:477 start_codon:yes stop_codon:yes gene_type:complete